jgi:CRISP-associated protein Cas1
LNKVTKYHEKEISNGYLILLKTRELAHFLTSKNADFNVFNPKLNVNRQDTNEIRQKILTISYADWKKRGFSKNGLHYMKKNARRDKPFTIQKHIHERLNK